MLITVLKYVGLYLLTGLICYIAILVVEWIILTYLKKTRGETVVEQAFDKALEMNVYELSGFFAEGRVGYILYLIFGWPAEAVGAIIRLVHMAKYGLKAH